MLVLAVGSTAADANATAAAINEYSIMSCPAVSLCNLKQKACNQAVIDCSNFFISFSPSYTGGIAHFRNPPV
jgi:hypothetical protein